MKDCAGMPQKIGSKFIHPIFLFYINTNTDKIKEKYTKEKNSVCPTKTMYNDKTDLFYSSRFVDKNDIKIDTNYFDLNIYLIYTYNIKSIQDALEWSKININLIEIATLDRVWNIVWEIHIKKDSLDSMLLDNLTNFYINYFKTKYYKDIEYEKIYKVIKNIIKEYAESNLTLNSKKGYQYLIKKNLNVI